jgi:hypothetical protein
MLKAVTTRLKHDWENSQKHCARLLNEILIALISIRSTGKLRVSKVIFGKKYFLFRFSAKW